MNTTASIIPQDIKLKTVIGNNMLGKTAKTKIDFNGNKRVTFTTAKSHNGKFYTSAQLSEVDDKGNYEVESFVYFQDYSNTLALHDIKRGTEKAILAAHSETINEKIEEVFAAVSKQLDAEIILK